MTETFSLDELRALDLNLLLVLSVMTRERSVRATAARLGLGSPAVSMSLSRLRLIFADPLFVRHSRGMVPTPRATELAALVGPFLQSLRLELLNGERFDLSSLRRTVRFAIADDLEGVLLAPLLAALQVEAPGVKLIVRDADWHSIDQALLSGEAEIIVAALIPDGSVTEPCRNLYRDRFVALFDPSQVAVGEILDIATYSATPQLLVSSRGETTGLLDASMKTHGATRHIMATLHRFSALPQILRVTKALCNVPSMAASQLAREHGLEIRSLPFESMEFQVGIAWQRTLDRDPLTRWLVDRVGTLVADLRRRPMPKDLAR